jgi:hypothetical protein
MTFFRSTTESVQPQSETSPLLSLIHLITLIISRH